MSLSKTLLSGLLVASFMVPLTGCTDEEFAFGAGIIIGIIIDDDGPHHHHDRHHRGGRRGGHHGGRHLVAQDTGMDLLMGTGPSDVEIVVAKYGISTESAVQLLANLEAIKLGQIDAVSELGLTKEQATKLMNGTELSVEEKVSMATALNISGESLESILSDIAI